ncbi:MAG: phosphatase PAP2 family protein [Planctomycetota bacterium]|jgi:membrane-associated phospholipid phosphatase
MSANQSRQIVLISFLLFATGCSSSLNQSHVSQSTERKTNKFCDAFYKALTDKGTIFLAASGAFFTISDFDERTAGWAARSTPIFGSQDAACDWSDVGNAILIGEAIGTSAYMGLEDPNTWTKQLLKIGGGITGAAVIEGLKPIFGRRRPDGSNRRSFPSGHSGTAFAFSAIANRNLDSVITSRGDIRQTLQIANNVLAASVAWARVEGERHYPLDVLMGGAIGRFSTLFFYEYFDLAEKNIALQIVPTTDSVKFQVAWRF